MKDGEIFFVAMPLQRGDDVYAFRPGLDRYHRVAAHKVYREAPRCYRHEALRDGDESDELIGIMSQSVDAGARIRIERGHIRFVRGFLDELSGDIVGIVSYYPDYPENGPRFDHLIREGGFVEDLEEEVW